MNKLVRILIYVAWAIFSLLVFIYLTFPTDVLRDAAEVQLERALPDYEIQIDGASLAGLTGVTLQGVRLLPRAGLAARPPAETGSEGESAAEGDAAGEATADAPTGAGDGEGHAPLMTLPTLIDEATVTVNPLSLGGGIPQADFELVLGGGAIYGSVEPEGESAGAYTISVNAQNVSLLPSLGILSNLLGAPMSGTLTGQVELQYRPGPEGRPVLSGGAIELVIQNLVRGPGALSLLYLETTTRMGDVRLSTALEGSDLNIATFTATGGPDFEMEVGGRVQLRSPLVETTLYLTAHLGFAPEWIEANGLASAFDAEPTLRASCADNQCAFRLQGRIGDGVRPEPLRR